MRQRARDPDTERKARALSARLALVEPGVTWRVHVAYEYRQPLAANLLASLPQDEPVWVVPLYAADSAFTHELTREAASARTGPVFVLGALAAEVLAEVSASHVLGHAVADSGWRGPDVALVLAAHGPVLDPPKPLDTGREATEALCTAIAARLSGHFGLVVNGWLNHTRGGRWTEPAIDEALAQVARAGFARVVYFPYGFLGDNAESQLEGRVALEAQPQMEARHLPCLNDAAGLVDLVARQVLSCAGTCAPRDDGRLGQRLVDSGSAQRDAGCYRACQDSAARGAACALCADRA